MIDLDARRPVRRGRHILFRYAVMLLMPAGCAPPPPPPSRVVTPTPSALRPLPRGFRRTEGASTGAATAPSPARMPGASSSLPGASSEARGSPPRRTSSRTEDVESERAVLAAAMDQLNLLREEVNALALPPAERAQVDAQFDAADVAWTTLRADLDAGRLPAPAEQATLVATIADARQYVQEVLGPEHMLQLASLRRSPRGGGYRWLARLRQSVEAQHPTPQQKRRLLPIYATLRSDLDALPAEEAPDEQADRAARDQVRQVVGRARSALEQVLTPEQMTDLLRRVPTLVKAPPATAPIAP